MTWNGESLKVEQERCLPLSILTSAQWRCKLGAKGLLSQEELEYSALQCNKSVCRSVSCHCLSRLCAARCDGGRRPGLRPEPRPGLWPRGYRSTIRVPDEAGQPRGRRPQGAPTTTRFTFRTARQVPRLRVMLVGWGGNNGSTLTAVVLANPLPLSWPRRSGSKEADYYGSLTQAGTVGLGLDAEGQKLFVPFNALLPMVAPNDLVFDGWDISSLHLTQAMRRAKVRDWELQEQLRPHMEALRPGPSVYIPEFNADNLIPGSRAQQLEQIRKDISDFRSSAGLDSHRLNDKAENLLRNTELGLQVSPSMLFAVASILAGCAFLSGSLRNTLLPGALELACQRRVFVGGDDLKSGQTKVESVLADFLISSGLKTMSIVSYNHVGNNDGQNLSAPLQFCSKEVSKSNVVDDMV
ncbi:Inositol-3-phosphate synthase 1 [Saguinus oedipus]|uniref:Inositol-3-phosphate synthase 1 n=1 Tax=Saguinus oedipus TaxID=9490 RepID=A0ABQ9VJG6_SAGOE|nr:Inositol-3-phosphate synthase 1 [Saguinus oedipus]